MVRGVREGGGGDGPHSSSKERGARGVWGGCEGGRGGGENVVGYHRAHAVSDQAHLCRRRERERSCGVV